ncbi:hypothetical protein [Winogradskyella vidalii]|uniref:hypothetical protein n=1 Tax=Winogradskyella vidalii TaxID=2615024 RepID=UPI0015CED4DB|nr:hypothetical protein [Winogradskyella vidalii]
MTIKTKITLLLLMVITAYSCDELDELTEFDVTENFTTSVIISAPEDSEGEPQEISQSTTLDISSNEDIQNNLDLIQDVTLNSLTYEISDFSGVEDATLTEGTLTFNTTSITLPNINLQQSDSNNTVYTINEIDVINAIANDLETDTTINASISGTVNATPVTFDVLINLDVTVTIDII